MMLNFPVSCLQERFISHTTSKSIFSLDKNSFCYDINICFSRIRGRYIFKERAMGTWYSLNDFIRDEKISLPEISSPPAMS